MSHQSDDRHSDAAFRVAFSHVTGIGPARLNALERFFEDLEEAWSADRSGLREAGLDQRTIEELEITRTTLDPHEAYLRMQESGIAALTPDDPEYPRRLKEIADPPPLLYARGQLLHSPSDALRHPDHTNADRRTRQRRIDNRVGSRSGRGRDCARDHA